MCLLSRFPPPLQGAAAVDVPGSGVPALAQDPGVSQTVQPDATLPRIARRPIVNWVPDLPTLAWAEAALDITEWTEADRTAIEEMYVSDPAYEHLFTAVPTPDSLYKSMTHSLTKERDYLFFEGYC